MTTAVPALPAVVPPGGAGSRAYNPLLAVMRQLRRDRFALGAAAFLALLFCVAVAAPVLAPYSPIQLRPSDALSPPSPGHWIGTDQFGRDILSRLMFGSSITLQVAFASVAISALVGVVLGLVAGYRGGAVDEAVMRLTDVLLAFPGILLALAIVATLQPGLGSVIIAVGISGAPHFARVTRGSTMSIKQNQYIEAARVCGCRDSRIMFLHVLPNVLPAIIVLMTLGLGTAILAGAALSFLGLGPKPPTPEWGTMLSAGRDFLRQAPWIINMPGVAIMLTVLAINILGDALRDALDPRLKA